MNVDEAKRTTHKLENDIAKLLEAFNRETELMVTDIKVRNNIQTLTGHTGYEFMLLVGVTCKVQL